MKLSNIQEVGTHFKRENIFLATLSDNPSASKELLGQLPEDLKPLSELLVRKGIIGMTEVDIFYKDENGYTCFELEENTAISKTFAGDNSDGKGFLRNIVSIWKYYSKGVKECQASNGVMLIAVDDNDPLDKYNEDYNLK